MKMSKVSKITVLAALFLLCNLVATFAAQSAPNSLQDALIGTWKLQDGGEVFIYRDDGTFTVSFDGQDVDGNYSLEGNRLTLTGEFETKTGDIIEINENQLKINEGDNTYTYIRQQNAPVGTVDISLQDALIGTWKLQSGSEVFIYRNDGTFTVSFGGQTIDGNYSLEGNKLTLTGEFETKTGDIIEIKENQLKINEGDNTHTYIRQ